MTATRVLAVDGGQSAIRLRHSGRPDVVEVEGVSRGGDTVAAVADRVGEGWRRGRSEPVDRVVLGLTTAPVDEAGRARLAGLIAAATGAPEVWVADDAVTAHAGALSLGWGVSVVAGTGVACLVVPDDGEPLILGGHGYLLGDEGGAFWIGREGLRAVLRAREGRAEPTGLAQFAEQRFGRLDDLHVRLHDEPRPVDAIAQFAPEVLAAAGSDATATRILRDAAWELCSLVEAAAHRTGRTEEVPVALGGRLLAPAAPLRVELDALLGGDPCFAVRTADAAALEGAMRLGLSGTTGRYHHLVHVWHEGTHA